MTALNAATSTTSDGVPSDATRSILDLSRDDVVIDLRTGDGSRSVLCVALDEPRQPTHPVWRRLLWRLVDVVVAGSLVLVTAPLMVALTLMVAMTSRGGPLFLQERVGRDGVTFRCAKFRTMRNGSEQLLTEVLANDLAAQDEWMRDHKLRFDPRITRIGRLLRRSNLDELPQLFNVIGGSMSIVGPRPVVPVETVRYGQHILPVLSVKPGITGLWQVSGRNDLPYDERVQLDLSYVTRKSLRLDARIVLRTVATMISGRGNGAY